MSFAEFYRIVEKFIDLLKMPGYSDNGDSDDGDSDDGDSDDGDSDNC